MKNLQTQVEQMQSVVQYLNDKVGSLIDSLIYVQYLEAGGIFLLGVAAVIYASKK